MNGGIEVRPVGGGDPLIESSLGRALAREYLIWDAFVGGKRRVDVHPLVLSPALHRAAIEAAESVVRVVGTIAATAHDDPRERAAYGLHADTLRLAAASRAAGDSAACMRVDLLLDESGEWKACEINADCPGGHNEALGLPKLARAAGFMHGANPTTVVDALVRRLSELADGGTVALIYATAYAEDLQVCALLQRLLEARGTHAVLAAPTAPRLRRGKVCVGNEPVRVLYRYFPTEWMDGQRNVHALADAVGEGRLRTMTGFQHIFTQSKLAFARAWWRKHELSPADQAAVATYLPYSVDLADVPRRTLLAQRKDWVIKRALGRVGDQVYVGALYPDDDWAPLVDDLVLERAQGGSYLAQKFVRQRTIPTPWGSRYVTLGAYVVDGAFAGYYARITTESHVSHDALCVPVFHEIERRAG